MYAPRRLRLWWLLWLCLLSTAAIAQASEPAPADTGLSPRRIATLVTLLLIVAYFLHRRYRRGKLAHVAANMGLAFYPDGSPDVADLSVFMEGDARRFNNLLKGTFRGLPTQVFDYSYRVTTGTDSYWYRVTIAAFCSPHASLPHFELGRNDIPFYSAQAKLGWEQSISFPSHSAFVRHWLLRGPDLAGIQRLFQPPLLEFFLAPGTDRNWHVERAAGGWVALYKQHGYRGYHQLRATQVPAFVEQAAVVAGAIFAEASVPAAVPATPGR